MPGIGSIRYDRLEAKRERDLDQAGQHFARFVAIVGVDAAIAILLHKAASRFEQRTADPGSPNPVFVKLRPGVQVRLRPDLLSGAGRSGET